MNPSFVRAIDTDNVRPFVQLYTNVSGNIHLIRQQIHPTNSLISAVKSRSYNVVELFMFFKFDARRYNRLGECAFDHALRLGDQAILYIFTKHESYITEEYVRNKFGLQLYSEGHSSLHEKKRKTPFLQNGTTDIGLGHQHPPELPRERDSHQFNDAESLKKEQPSVQKTNQQNLIVKLKECGVSEKIYNTVHDKIIKISPFNNREHTEWIENFFKIPFNKYAKLPVNKKDNTIEEIHSYVKEVNHILNEAAYGMENVKEDIIDITCQLISSEKSNIKILGLCGSPGVGKTNIIKNGLSKILNRPFQHICMGGINDSSYLVGHDFTYKNSRYGLIVNTLINSGVMNPIIFMDELDKISSTPSGTDIQNVLIHLTDPVQNNAFMDKYFMGIEIDLSKVMFVFSFNDKNNIHPILRDRIQIIHVKNPTVSDKINITNKHLIPSILSNLDTNSKIIITPENITRIINQHCKNDVGVRHLKHLVEKLVLKINTSRYNPLCRYKSLKNIDVDKVEVSQTMINEILEKVEDDSFISSMYV